MTRTAKQERARAERYRRRCSVLLRALEGCLESNLDWSGGMEEIYEFIRARRLVERYRKWAKREFFGIECSRFAMENYNEAARKKQEEFRKAKGLG